MKRAAYKVAIAEARAEGFSPVYVDESGFASETLRQHGYAVRGVYVSDVRSSQHYRRTSLIAARLDGNFMAPLLFTGSCNVERFNEWLQTALCPHLNAKHFFDDHLSPLRAGSSNIEFTYDIHTRDLEHLDNIGLIRFAGPQGTDLGEDADRIYSDGPIEASYYGECIRLHTVHGSRIGPPIGRVRLTQTGKELYPICRNTPEGSLPVDGIFGLGEWGGS